MQHARRLLLAGLVALGTTPSQAMAQPALPPFYAAASTLTPDGPLGTVLRQEPVPTRIPGAQAWRIAYVASDVANRRTVVTGLLVAPTGPAPAEGRAVIAWAHGTTGTAQNCGPSQVFDPAQELNQYFLPSGTSWTDFGVPALGALIRAGHVVVATDYQGLGGGGRHQYAVAATQARDVVDSVRAARAVREAGAGDRAIVMGWSQGGGATLAAASLRDYIGATGTAADGTRFLGFVAMAPQDVAALARGKAPDEASAAKLMGELATTFSDTVFNFAHFAMTMWGTQAAYPGLALTDLFTPEGAAAVDQVFGNKCMHAGADTLSYAYGAQYRTMLAAAPRNAPAWTDALVAGSVAPVAPVAPVLIFWGTHDTVVPPVMGQLYQAEMCGRGGNVARVQLPGQQTHFSTPGAAATQTLAWIAERLAGGPAPGGCPAR